MTLPPHLTSVLSTSDDDIGIDVALGSSGRVYTLVEERGYVGPYIDEEYNNGYSYTHVMLRQYDSAGKLIQNKYAMADVCLNEDINYEESCNVLEPRALESNTQGYLYGLYTYTAPSNGCGQHQSS